MIRTKCLSDLLLYGYKVSILKSNGLNRIKLRLPFIGKEEEGEFIA